MATKNKYEWNKANVWDKDKNSNRKECYLNYKSISYKNKAYPSFNDLFYWRKADKLYLMEHTYCNKNKINPFLLDIMKDIPELKDTYTEFTKGKTYDQLLGSHLNFKINNQITLVILFTIKGEYSNHRIDKKVSNKLIDEVIKECDTKSIAFRTFINHNTADHILYNFDEVENICTKYNKEFYLYKCELNTINNPIELNLITSKSSFQNPDAQIFKRW